jgi:Ni,Fe-hydrogenase I cytochrome b subunit
LLIVVLALRGTLRFLFFVWSLAVVVLIVKGYYLSGYRFSPNEPKSVLYLFVGSIVALMGSWFVMTRRAAR